MNTNQAAAQDVTIGVVGDGFGALLVYSTASTWASARPDRHLREEPPSRPRPTSNSPGTSARRCSAPSPSPTSCRRTGPPSRSSTPTRAATRAAVPLGRPQVQPWRARHHGRGRDRGRPARDARPRDRRHARRLGRPRARAAPALLALRRGCAAARPRQARDAGAGPWPACLPRHLRQGAREPGDGRPHRAGLRGQAVLQGRPLHRRRLRHRLGERVGQLHRGRCPVHRPAAQPAPRPAGPQRAALPVRRLRHRRVPGPRLRRPRRLPRQGAQGHRAEPPQLERDHPQGREAGLFEEVIGNVTDIQPGPGRAQGHAASCTTARTSATST